MVRLVGMIFLASALVQKVGTSIEAGGVLVLFGILLICGLGLPLPEDIPLMIAGFLVGKGQMHLATAGLAAWCGIMGGDLILYHLGKKFGLEITRVPFIGKHVTKERITKAEVLFEKYGVWVVAVGRLFAGVRGGMVIAAGASRFNLVKFVIADGLAAIVSGGLFIWLGYWIGKKMGSLEDLHAARKSIAGAEHWVVLGLVIVLAGFVTLIWWRRRSHTMVADKLLIKAADRAEKKHPQ